MEEEQDIEVYEIKELDRQFPEFHTKKMADGNIIVHLDSGSLFSFSGLILTVRSAEYDSGSSTCIATFEVSTNNNVEFLERFEDKLARHLAKSSPSLFGKKLRITDITKKMYPILRDENRIAFEIYKEEDEVSPTFFDSQARYNPTVSPENFGEKYIPGSIMVGTIILRYLVVSDKDEIDVILDLFQLSELPEKSKSKVESQITERQETKKEEEKQSIPEPKKEETEAPKVLLEGDKKENIPALESESDSSSSDSSSGSDSDSESSSDSEPESDHEEEAKELEAERNRIELLKLLEAEKVLKEKERLHKEKKDKKNSEKLREKEKDKKKKGKK